MTDPRIHTTFDATEPKATSEARATYWTKRHELDQLEGRIQMTDAGLDWLMRVKKI